MVFIFVFSKCVGEKLEGPEARRLAVALCVVCDVRLLKIQKFECVAENNNAHVQ